MTRVFLLKGVSSFPDPGNWTSSNVIECLGAGFRGTQTVLDETTRYGGNGGGAGGYGYKLGVTNPFPVAVNVATKNSDGIFNSASLANTWWGSSSENSTSVQGFCGGAGPSSGPGPGPGGRFYPLGFKGGDGAYAMIGSPNGCGNGGGGAAGPMGAGLIGTRSTGAGVVGKGGAADNGTNLGGQTIGANGTSGTQWDATHGCGGGGAGGHALDDPGGGAGGTYGGGGGGQGASPSASAGGNGGDGLLVITYQVQIPDLQTRAMIVM